MVLLIPHKGREGEREGKGRRTPRRRSKRKGNKNGQEEREIEGQQKKWMGHLPGTKHTSGGTNE